MKKLLIVLVVLFVLAIASLFIFGNFVVSQGIRTAAVSFGPEVTGVPIAIEEVETNLLGGSITIQGLRVGSPENFSAEETFSVARIEFGIEPASLFSDRIVINRLRVIAPDVAVEQKLRGNNLQAILRNVKEFTGPGASDQPPAEGQKVVAIKELVVLEGRVTAMAGGQQTSLLIPSIEYENLGGEQGITPQEAVATVIQLVLETVIQELAKNPQFLQEAGMRALEQGGQVLEDAKGKADEVLKGVEGLFGGSDDDG